MKATCPECGYTVRAASRDDASYFDAGICPECGCRELTLVRRRTLSDRVRRLLDHHSELDAEARTKRQEAMQ